MPTYQRGSGFVGLRDYLNANPEAGQRMGNELATQVEQQGAAAQGAIDTQRGLIEQQIAAGTPTLNTYGLDTGEVEALRSMPPAYTGPQDMGNVDALNAQALQAQQAAQLGGTDAGRSVLMQRSGTAAPTVGGRSLDAALAGRGAGNRLAAATSRFGELQKYLSGAQQQVGAKVQGAKEQTARVREQIAAMPAPQFAPSAPPPPAREDPRVKNARDINARNRLVQRHGGRG